MESDKHTARTVIVPEALLVFARERMRDGDECAVLGSPVGNMGGGRQWFATKIVLPFRREVGGALLAGISRRFDQQDRRVVGVLRRCANGGFTLDAAGGFDRWFLRDGKLTDGGREHVLGA